ncbi:MAG TPA: DUF1905 domain-containing protein [Chloroflexota bacterium]|jgi:hypothetical protein|nr:DUF1905 domain-containing protein [Chloroflexota bacterium]
MTIAFTGKLWFWRGPAPWYFVTVSAKQGRELQAIAGFVTYGWGMIPVTVHVGNTEWQTSLFPKAGRYLVPIKARVREAEHLAEGDDVRVRLDVRVGRTAPRGTAAAGDGVLRGDTGPDDR